MVEVFKTNIQEQYQAQKLIEVLTSTFPECKINFDLLYLHCFYSFPVNIILVVAYINTMH